MRMTQIQIQESMNYKTINSKSAIFLNFNQKKRSILEA
jgi:hypothetical protein